MNGFVKSCALALAACLLAGCAPALPPQPTLDELLAEVNAAHQVVNEPQFDGSLYVTRGAPDVGTLVYFTSDLATFDFDLDAEVTAAQAAEDVAYLFGAFCAFYGPYDCLGGEAAFGEHKADLVAWLEEKELRGF